MDGLVPGRIVYFVFNEQAAKEVMRRRTTAQSIAERMRAIPPAWPAGAQAHIGNDVKAGDIYPAMVLRVWGSSGCSNLRVFLDGSDDYWGISINYDAGTPGPEGAAEAGVYAHYSWHWMFDGQQKRYTPNNVK
jgi:hypothetical protein